MKPLSILLLALSIFFIENNMLAANEKISPERQTELLYLLHHDCGACHGMTLNGGLGPALLPETLSTKPKPFLRDTILEGRPGTPMPPWRDFLTPIEVEWLVEQLINGIPTK
jgi:cytochrome c55X